MSSDIIATIRARAAQALERHEALVQERQRLIRKGHHGAALALSSEIHRMRQVHTHALLRLKALADDGDLIVGKENSPAGFLGK